MLQKLMLTLAFIFLFVAAGCVGDQSVPAGTTEEITEPYGNTQEPQPEGAADSVNAVTETKWKEYDNIGLSFEYLADMELNETIDRYDDGKGYAVLIAVNEKDTVLNRLLLLTYINYSAAYEGYKPDCPTGTISMLLLEDKEGDQLFAGILNQSVNKSNITGNILPSSYSSSSFKTYAEMSFTILDGDEVYSGYAIDAYNCDNYGGVSMRILGRDREEVDELRAKIIETFAFE
jgi:hypothetical protein